MKMKYDEIARVLRANPLIEILDEKATRYLGPTFWGKVVQQVVFAVALREGILDGCTIPKDGMELAVQCNQVFEPVFGCFHGQPSLYPLEHLFEHLGANEIQFAQLRFTEPVGTIATETRMKLDEGVGGPALLGPDLGKWNPSAPRTETQSLERSIIVSFYPNRAVAAWVHQKAGNYINSNSMHAGQLWGLLQKGVSAQSNPFD
jgi:hypothetical protein